MELDAITMRCSVEPDLLRYIPAALPWIHEAGNPYFDWLFGGSTVARRSLGRWMERPSSEVAISRVKLLLDGDCPIGGFIAMGRTELAACRRADFLALFQKTENRRNAELLTRLKAARGLFSPVAVGEFYLSRVGVAADRRGLGWGRHLALRYIAMGREAGFGRFRLDVWAENARAVRLYESLGFRVVGEQACLQARLRYLTMVREGRETADELEQ